MSFPTQFGVFYNAKIMIILLLHSFRSPLISSSLGDQQTPPTRLWNELPPEFCKFSVSSSISPLIHHHLPRTSLHTTLKALHSKLGTHIRLPVFLVLNETWLSSSSASFSLWALWQSLLFWTSFWDNSSLVNKLVPFNYCWINFEIYDTIT